MRESLIDISGKIDDSYLQGPGGFQFFRKTILLAKAEITGLIKVFSSVITSVKFLGVLVSLVLCMNARH